MFHTKGDGCGYVVVPLHESLTWESVDKVDADIVDAGLTECVDSLADIRCTMSAAEKTKSGVVEGLCPHTHTIDGKRGKQRGKLGRDVVGIALDGHFGGVRTVDMLKKALELLWGQRAWSAASEIHSLPFVGAIIGAHVKLAA